MDVVSVGNANVDLKLYVRETPPVGGQVESTSFERCPGGAALNFAIAAARLGARSAVLCCVGSDEGDWLVSELEACGVDTSLVVRVSAPTGFVVVLVDERGERTMVAYRGANAHLLDAVRARAGGIRAEWVHAASVKPAVAEAVFTTARRAGAGTSYDPGGVVARMGFKSLSSALSLASVLFLNEVEAKCLAESGGGEGLERVKRLVGTLVVKMGARGSYAVRAGERARAPAFKVPVVDTTGAGDVFDAAFLLATRRGLDLQEALTLANACAAVNVSRRAPISSLNFREVIEFLRQRGLSELAAKLERPKNLT